MKLRDWNETDVVEFSGEGMSVQKQVELYRSARCQVGPHGAGLVHMIFAPTNFGTAEVTPGDYNPEEPGKPNGCMRNVAWALHQRHAWLVVAGATASSTLSADPDGPLRSHPVCPSCGCPVRCTGPTCLSLLRVAEVLTLAQHACDSTQPGGVFDMQGGTQGEVRNSGSTEPKFRPLQSSGPALSTSLLLGRQTLRRTSEPSSRQATTPRPSGARS